MFGNLFVTNLFVVVLIMCTVLINSCENNKIEGGNKLTVYESKYIEFNESEANDNHYAVVLPANDLPKSNEDVMCKLEVDVNHVDSVNNEFSDYPEITYSKNWSIDEAYLLAKIAMAEAEGEGLETKVLIMLTVLNRVHSVEFPNTIEEVIFENHNGEYQFTPISNGRWDRVEPNEECFEALRIVYDLKYDISNGALFFEACQGDSWHSRNLEFIRQSDNTRFYK